METQSPRRRWYQFSLREMLLATVAIAAVTALIMEKKNRPYLPTPFIESFREQLMLQDCCSDLGVELVVRSTIGSRKGEVIGTIRGGHRDIDVDVTFSEPDIDVLQTVVMEELRSRIEELLEDSGCAITGRTTAATAGDERLEKFHFRYLYGGVQGVVRVISMKGSDGDCRLRFLTDEW